MTNKYMDFLTSTKGWFYTNSFAAITSFASLFYPENIEQTNSYLETGIKILSIPCVILGGLVSFINICKWFKVKFRKK